MERMDRDLAHRIAGLDLGCVALELADRLVLLGAD
jgi:hypothetical protein